jgi:hypothetical protein
MIEKGTSGPDIFDRIERNMDKILDVHTRAVEYLTDLGYLAQAYTYEALENVDERVFGKVELCPANSDFFSRSTLRFMQWRIITQVGDYFIDQSMNSSFSIRQDTPFGDSTESAGYKLADRKLDTMLNIIINGNRTDIPGFTPGTKRKWGYARAALAIFDEIQSKKNDMSVHRLEMRKMILLGSGGITPSGMEFALEIMKTTDRDQLVVTLQKYISAE